MTHDESGVWTNTTIYNFALETGGLPTGGLVYGKDGKLYGTTSFGGNGNGSGGTAFQLARNESGVWIETDIYDFDVNVAGSPNTTMILDEKGNLYGTFGGGPKPGVFKLQHRHQNWRLDVVHRFPFSTSPTNSVAFDALGNLYSTTYRGGAFGVGMVYKLSPSGHGWTRSVLYNFRGKADGGYSTGPLAVDAQGNLYGSAEEGGQYRYGVVFKITP